MDRIKLLEKLTNLNAVSGREKSVHLAMKDELTEIVDEFDQDGLGSLITKQIGNKTGPKIMLAGHMDEIGFILTRIDKEGFLFFKPIGGWWGHVLLNQIVTITTREGKEFVGVIGSTPPHILKKDAQKTVLATNDMYIDIGVTSEEEVEELGIKPGDMITPRFKFSKMANPKFLLAKAFDNRVGCGLIIEIMKEFKKTEHPNIVYGVGTVQEEVGCRGAKTTANIIAPDISFSFDVGLAGDTPGITEKDTQGKLGKGPLVHILDSGTIGHFDLINLITDTAKEFDIPFQYDSLSGGATDNSSIHISNRGCPSVFIGVSTRYIHSHASIIHEDDYNNTIKLMIEVIKKLDRETVNKITFTH